MDEKQRLEALEKMLNVVQSNVNFSLGLTWAILGVVVAIIGVALYFLAKMWVQKVVNNDLAKIKEDLELEFEGYINALPPRNQFAWASGNSIINTDGILTISGLDIKDMNAFRAFHIVEVTTVLGRRLNFDMEIRDNGLVMKLVDLNQNEVFQHGWASINWKVIWLKELRA